MNTQLLGLSKPGLSGRDSPSAVQWSDLHTLSPLIPTAILTPI